MGAPGYVPHPELPPHAAMPGAPPYPAPPDPLGEERPPPPRVGTASTWTCVLGATAVWAVVNLVLVVLVAGAPPSAGAAGRTFGGIAVALLLGSLLTWVVVRTHAWRFWVLVLAAAPAYWVLRAFTNLPGAGS